MLQPLKEDKDVGLAALIGLSAAYKNMPAIGMQNANNIIFRPNKGG